ncbi:hypothetical protein CONLIGDRAFT_680555 [Coniochaeta ligniaria NRRL 30616]|uniref:Copper acquisition factor BIM1-like domain-containing protein n=1 Tax=Coniochaeta ligniaria NRRL 30616 TaxID=1408157 RepID=A0A1J7IQI0_9PEZI|nr:hypothetical protein CONLIGDRAFT_680555 [Coniochaeta ligniaria NRRL 30616]
MARLQFAILAAAAVRVMATSEDMGPAAFMWPSDRVWNAAMDNTAPCGSVDDVTTRTQFPLDGGVVALVAQDDSYSVTMSISFKNNPSSQSDFTYILTPIPITEVDPGHTCLGIADPPSDIAAGTNATIQIKYTADFDRPENQTFYACADITYVAAAGFNSADVPCFNATTDVDVPAPTGTGTPTDLPGHGDNGPPLTTASASTSAAPQEGGSSGGVTLSKGAIAGAVVGAVVGLALLVGLGVFFYRERQTRMRLERQRDSARGVGWRADDPGKDSVSAGSFQLGNVAK